MKYVGGHRSANFSSLILATNKKSLLPNVTKFLVTILTFCLKLDCPSSMSEDILNGCFPALYGNFCFLNS